MNLDISTKLALDLFLEQVRARFDVEGAYLFGSRARQDHRPDSDADIAVLLRGQHQRFLPTKLAMAGIAYDVLLETGIDISPLPLWMDQWEHPETWSNPRLLENIAREGVPLRRKPAPC
jgi:predicted nucleotidyltransferase